MLAMGNKLVESFETLAKDSRSTLIEYLEDCVERVRFFSYGSNMNKKKFKEDMKKAAEDLKLKLSEKEKTRLELDKLSKKRVLANFKRELSNESEQHGRAFSIFCSSGNGVQGICHDVHVSVLPAFLKKEGLLPSKGKPSYKLIKVYVSGEDQEVLTLLGLKPKPIKYLKQKKIQDALKYVNDSIKGAKDFNVEHSDMKKVKELLISMQTQAQDPFP